VAQPAAADCNESGLRGIVRGCGMLIHRAVPATIDGRRSRQGIALLELRRQSNQRRFVADCPR